MNRLSSAESSASFTTALLLVRHEDHAVVDRRALRDAGIRNVKVLTSGVEAARILHTNALVAARPGAFKEGPDLVFCHEQLGDMTGDAFVRLIRLHPLLLPFPILVAVASDTHAVRSKATESGYSGLLPRPYPQTALRSQLQHAATCRDATREALQHSTNTDTSAFEAALDYFVSQDAAHSQDAEKVYRSGLLAVRQQRWDESITTLQRASRLDPDNGKVLIALAAAWRGKGNADKSSAMLQEAVSVLVKNRDWAQALLVSQRLTREYPGMPHPLHSEARRLVAAGNMEDAAQALFCDEAALDTVTGKKNLCEQMFRGCRASADPERAVSELYACLATAGHASLGKAIQGFVLERMAQDSNGSEESAADGTPVPFSLQRIELASEHTSETFAERFSELSQGRNTPLPAAGTPDLTTIPDTASDAYTKTAAPGSRKKTRTQQDASTPQVIALLTEPSTPAALKQFPRLSDALAVARVTMGLFKARKKNRA